MQWEFVTVKIIKVYLTFIHKELGVYVMYSRDFRKPRDFSGSSCYGINDTRLFLLIDNPVCSVRHMPTVLERFLLPGEGEEHGWVQYLSSVYQGIRHINESILNLLHQAAAR